MPCPRMTNLSALRTSGLDKGFDKDSSIPFIQNSIHSVQNVNVEKRSAKSLVFGLDVYVTSSVDYWTRGHYALGHTSRYYKTVDPDDESIVAWQNHYKDSNHVTWSAKSSPSLSPGWWNTISFGETNEASTDATSIKVHPQPFGHYLFIVYSCFNGNCYNAHNPPPYRTARANGHNYYRTTLT